MDIVQDIKSIAINPVVRNSRPYLLGTTITVADVVIAHLYHGQDGDGIASWYDLTLPQVYAALAYYYAHKDGIDEQIRDQIQRAETLKEQRLGGQDSLLPG